MKTKHLKLTVIGAGSSYTPELIDGIIRRSEKLPIKELWLVDIPEGEKKLHIITNLVNRMIKKAGLAIEVHATFDRKAAIRDADFVLTQIRVGGLDARAKDEQIPLQYQVIGQETTGPGGFAKALRTIPVILDICKDIETYAPNAWLINFTNPSGIITEAILNHTTVRAIGLCNVPICVKMEIARLLNIDAQKIKLQFVGLNHMGYITSVELNGQNILNEIIPQLANINEDYRLLSLMKYEESFLRTLGMLPNPYNRFYYRNKDMLFEMLQQAQTIGTRAQQVIDIENNLFQVYSNESLCEKPQELDKRGGAFYSEAAISLVESIYTNRGDHHVVNIRNQGTIAELPDDAVIEADAIVNEMGAKVVCKLEMPDRISGILSHVKAYEQLTVKAAVTQSADAALFALVNHPLMHDYNTTKAIFQELLTAHSEYLSYLQ